MKELRIQNKTELEAFARDFLMMLKEKKETMLKNPSSAGSLVVGLSGDLGSGKTTFSQIVARLLGVDETVTSPTFIIQKSYKTKDPVFQVFTHIDAYRIEEESELKSLGFREQLEIPNSLMFIEWPEKIQDALPPDTGIVSFEFINESERVVRYE